MKKHLLFFLLLFLPLSALEKVRLTWDWNAPLADVAEFKVYELIDSNWAFIRSVPKGADGLAPLTILLTNLTPGVHTYRVTAVLPAGESDPSNAADTSQMESPSPPVVAPPVNLHIVQQDTL